MNKLLLLGLLAFVLVGCTQQKTEAPAITPTATIEPSVEASVSPAPSPIPSASPTPSASPSPEASPTPLPSETPSPSPTPVVLTPSCVVNPEMDLVTGPVELVVSATFINLVNTTNGSISCSASDSGAVVEINENTGFAFRRCSYGSVSSQKFETVSAKAGGASCTSTVVVNANVSLYPLISGVKATSLKPASAVVAWITDLASNSKVEYGTTVDYGLSASDSALVANHSLNLTSLTASTAYHYRVTSCRDSYCNVSQDYSFTTPAPVYSFSLTPSSETLDVSKALNGTGTRTYTLVNTGNVALTGFTCASDKTSVWPATDCGTLSVADAANASIVYNYNVLSEANGPYSAVLTVSHASAGSKTVSISAVISD